MAETVAEAARIESPPPEEIVRQAKELAAGAEILPGGLNALALRIWQARQANRPLRVKLGVDPTGTRLHLGHTVVLRRLRRFQDFGHQAVLIIGGFTARIGDPTGRSNGRTPLTAEEVDHNAAHFLQQVSTILHVPSLQVRNNAEWLASMDLTAVLKLAASTTVNRLIGKEAFGQRLDAHKPVGLHELFYPLLQGWDSVVVEADVEIGGTDQRFNILQGRELQEANGQLPQIAMMLPILEGTDGQRKMSKSFGNDIALNDTASDVFAKAMRLPDALILKFFELATNLPSAQVDSLREQLGTGANPMHIKQQLARQLVLELHGADIADRTLNEWLRVHCRGETPSEVPTKTMTTRSSLVAILVECGFAASNNRARELIRSGGVRLNGDKALDPACIVEAPTASGILIQAGKRHFVRLVPGDNVPTVGN